ncbi:MAG: hypothetical protein MUE30_16675, partial [Spirosomaceae bacterium]|nr:hypothetical protein [Spirosomataceae bacterium]
MRYVSVVIWLLCFVWTLTGQFPSFVERDSLTLLLMPLLWVIAYQWIVAFRPDKEVFTPKNVLLFIWLNKLVIVPFELLIWGNQTPQLDTHHQPILREVSVILLSFGAFWAGWRQYDRQIPIPSNPVQRLVAWAGTYLGVGLGSLVLLYGSLSAYWNGAIFTYITRATLDSVGGTVWGLLANIGQRFWAFGVMLAWIRWHQKYPPRHWTWHVPWGLLCAVGVLSSNRANMVYPMLTFGAIVCARWQFRHKWGLAVGLVGIVLLSFFFGYLRTQPALDTQHVAALFDDYWNSPNHYILYAHQLYFGSPYQITPLLHIPLPSFTLGASVLDPIPLIGKAFREHSGPFVYNMAIQSGYVAQDKVIPVAGELYFNGGWVLVVLGHWAFGWAYRFLDDAFKTFITTDLVLAMAFFYVALLFNATLLLSLTVLVQLF